MRNTILKASVVIGIHVAVTVNKCSSANHIVHAWNPSIQVDSLAEAGRLLCAQIEPRVHTMIQKSDSYNF